MTSREAIAAIGVALCLLVGAPFSLGQPSAPAEPASASPALAPTADAGRFDDECGHFAYGDELPLAQVTAVRHFLSRHQCPIEDLAPEFVRASALNDLDYRLLPTLAVLETGCGRATRNHNLFGWANGKKPFASFQQAIHHVAQRLRLAPHYAGKTTLEKLRMYNRRGAYRAKVLRIMETIGQPQPIPSATLH